MYVKTEQWVPGSIAGSLQSYTEKCRVVLEQKNTQVPLVVPFCGATESRSSQS
jgi:hypothetical protein